MMRDELSHKRTLELAQAHSSSTTNPVPMVGHFDVGKYFQVKHVHACYCFCAESAAGSR